MFWAIVSPILRNTRLCFYSFVPEAVKTQSSVSEDGRNYRPKHVELITVINKLSLLHLVGYLYYYKSRVRCLFLQKENVIVEE